MEDICFKNEINNFVEHINTLKSSLPFIMHMMTLIHGDKELKLEELIKDGHVTKKETEDGILFQVKVEYKKDFDIAIKELQELIIAHKLIPRSFIVSLISQFDVYIGRLLRVIYLIEPRLLNISEKSLSISQIFSFDSFDEVKQYILEKEIESLLRMSHTEQFDWLESKLKIQLRKGLDIWSDFIELTERRNLYVHCDGVISSQYLKVCNNNFVCMEDDINIGDRLFVTPEYYKKACFCILELGIKLGSVLWRKFQPGDLEDADEVLNEICYDLIQYKDYDLAIKLLQFATELPRFSSKQAEYIFIINKAQAYKWNSNIKKCKEIIESIDWTACADSFKLAVHVLLNEFDEAVEFMKKLGTDGMPKLYYTEWPLFKEFRKSEQFLLTYKEVFSEEYETIESEVVLDVTGDNQEKVTGIAEAAITINNPIN